MQCSLCIHIYEEGELEEGACNSAHLEIPNGMQSMTLLDHLCRVHTHIHTHTHTHTHTHHMRGRTHAIALTYRHTRGLLLSELRRI